MTLIEAIKKIEPTGMKVLLEADRGGLDLLAYAWSDEHGYECKLTLPMGIYCDRLNEDEIAVLERLIARRSRNAAAA
jgi:hypothetical protein